jgi:hypothetical protein
VDVDEFAGTMKLEGAFGADQDTVTVGGTKVQIQSWSPTEIVCNLPQDAVGDVLVTVRGLKSNPRPLTEWDAPLQYKWVVKGGVFTWQGSGTLKYRLDVSGFRNKPGEGPTYLRRGTWPMQSSTFSITGTAQGIAPCALVGGTVTIPTIPNSGGKPSFYLNAPLIADPNSHTGLIGLALAGSPPWALQCPASPSVPETPSFSQLSGPGFFFDSEEENVPAVDGPITETAVAFDKDMGLLDLSFTDVTAGTLTVKWQGATESSPPRPNDAGI